MFKFENKDNYFVVENTNYDRSPVKVEVIPDRGAFKIYDLTNSFYRTTFPVSEYRNMLRHVAERLTPLHQDCKWWAGHTDKNMPRRIVKESVNFTYNKIIKRFAASYQLLKRQIRPEILEVNRSLYSAIGNCTFLNPEEIVKLSQHKYWFQDISKYPASVYVINFHKTDISIRDKDIEEILDLNWMKEYSIDGKTYKSLNKTLMSMPRQMPKSVVYFFKAIKLNRPLYGKANILFNLPVRDVFDRDTYISRHRHIYEKTPNEEIIRVARMARRRGFVFKMNRTMSILDFKRYIEDYPDDYHGDFEGLFKRAYRWHMEARYDTPGTQYSKDKKLATPAWGEIDNKNITFLSTVGDLEKESERMRHCVRSYASRCVRGRSFIYHINYKKARATLEVSPSGMVVQAYGPMNGKNVACGWGAKKIKEHLKTIGHISEPLKSEVPF